MSKIIRKSKEYNDVLYKLAEELSINDILDILDIKVDNNHSLESVSTLQDGQKRHIIVTEYKYEADEEEP